MIYSDCSYEGLVDYGAKEHYRVKHSKNEFRLIRENPLKFNWALNQIETIFKKVCGK